jgi:hypothetical protein
MGRDQKGKEGGGKKDAADPVKIETKYHARP